MNKNRLLLAAFLAIVALMCAGEYWFGGDSEVDETFVSQGCADGTYPGEWCDIEMGVKE